MVDPLGRSGSLILQEVINLLNILQEVKNNKELISLFVRKTENMFFVLEPYRDGITVHSEI